MRCLYPTLLGAAMVAAASYGAWGPSGCHAAPGPVGPNAYAPSPRYQWRAGPTDPDQIHLFEGVRQLGTFRYSTDTYHPLTGEGWGGPTLPPASAPPVPGVAGKALRTARAAPCACSAGCPCDVGACHCDAQGVACAAGCVCGVERIAPPPIDYGMAWKPGGVERYSLNGIPVERIEGIQAIEAGIPDDRHKQRLTGIGGEAERKRLEQELRSPQLAGWLDRLLVQTYAPDHWAVKDAGFVTSGKPTVYLQGPPDAKGRGPVLSRQDDADDGASGLLAALRRADPDYRPEADRDLRKPEPILPRPLKWLTDAGDWIFVGLIVLAVYLLIPKGGAK